MFYRDGHLIMFLRAVFTKRWAVLCQEDPTTAFHIACGKLNNNASSRHHPPASQYSTVATSIQSANAITLAPIVGYIRPVNKSAVTVTMSNERLPEGVYTKNVAFTNLSSGINIDTSNKLSCATVQHMQSQEKVVNSVVEECNPFELPWLLQRHIGDSEDNHLVNSNHKIGKKICVG